MEQIGDCEKDDVIGEAEDRTKQWGKAARFDGAACRTEQHSDDNTDGQPSVFHRNDEKK